ncbi:hypothetical protein B0H16DRAFT_691413 [Mycena metata]|uniref:Uncharacterized protein n=1 Tax=Mycena metata TaxID=1033252 RepID=A0AAD7GUP9_9AGAR|nr:hypothetical protein B0H16DRAFT_691413 [Mycena metata]
MPCDAASQPIGTLVSNPSPASRSALDAFIPAFMGSSSMLHNTPSPFLDLPASSASSASRSTSNALIWAFMGSWRTSFNAPSPSFSFPVSSSSSASQLPSIPLLDCLRRHTISPHISFGWRRRVPGWYRGECHISQILNIPFFLTLFRLKFLCSGHHGVVEDDVQDPFTAVPDHNVGGVAASRPVRA